MTKNLSKLKTRESQLNIEILLWFIFFRTSKDKEFRQHLTHNNVGLPWPGPGYPGPLRACSRIP